MKTPEEFMAEEYAKDMVRRDMSIRGTSYREENCLRMGYLAGYKAAQQECETKIQELETQLENWQHNAVHGDEGL